jgi:hypothetical protein
MTTSRHAYRTRQLQGVEADGGCASSDHTFRAARNFRVRDSKRKPKAVWDVATGLLSVACLILVATTRACEWVHAAEELAHRPGWRPNVHYTDTWPSQETLWSLLWPFARGRLGIFHWMKRLTKTLRPEHRDFGKAIRRLSEVAFQCDDSCIYDVETALKDGSLNGVVHDDDDIADLKASGAFWKRYREYIRKTTHKAGLIAKLLENWRVEFAPSNETFDENLGDYLFTRATDPAIEVALTRINDITDIAEHYKPKRRKPRQKHNLTGYKCDRGEKVETFHGPLAHYGNPGMSPYLAQAVTIEGALMFTMDREQEERYNKGEVESATVEHYEPWLRLQANAYALLLGLSLCVFNFVWG